MKRLFGLAIALGLFAAAAFASDNIRAAQTKLKEGGFYFGAIDGALSSDFSAAVTRYQIRNGLQITGNLNAETSKALGVQAEVTKDQAAAPGSETWRRLRSSDERATAGNPAAADGAPTTVLEPAGNGSTFVLDPDRLRDYVAAFVLAGLDPHVGSELEFFGSPVRYYGGLVGREKIRADLQRYAAQWPERRFWLAGELNVNRQPDSRIRVSFPLRYELANGAKRRSGKVLKTIVLEVHGPDLQIVSVNERKA